MIRIALTFVAHLFKSSAQKRIERLITQLQQDRCNDGIQEELYQHLDAHPDALQKEMDITKPLEYAHIQEALTQQITPKTANERATNRQTRKEKRKQKRLARGERKEARKLAREQRRTAKDEAKKQEEQRLNTGKRYEWRNAIQSQVIQPLRIWYPQSLEDIINIVEEAEELGVKVRAIGSGHSCSNIGVTSDYFMYTDGIDEPLELDKSVLKEGARNLCLFEAEAGITVRELNGELADIGYALPNAGGSDVQTIMGAVSTSTHGSGIGLGSYPDLIRSIELVTTGGQVLRLEPSDGITDPAKYVHADIPLVQDDDLFYAALVSMGSMGVVYSFIMEVVPSYWLKEERLLWKWSDLKPKLMEGSIIRNNEHFEVYFNPYSTDGDYTCIVTTRNRIEVQEKPKGPAGRRNFLSGLLMSFKLTPEIILRMFDLIPHKTPQMIDRAMQALIDEAYIDVSYRVLNQGLRQVKTLGTAIEIGFSMDQYLDAVEHLMAVTRKRALVGCQYVTSPVALRFVKGSKHHLAMTYGRDTCMIEIPTLAQSKGRKDILIELQKELMALGGRPHWGLEVDLLTGSNDQVKQLYPKYDTFMKAFKHFNSKGTFNNVFTDRVGFS